MVYSYVLCTYGNAEQPKHGLQVIRLEKAFLKEKKKMQALPLHADTEEIPKADLGYVVGDVLIVLQVCVLNVCGPRSY